MSVQKDERPEQFGGSLKVPVLVLKLAVYMEMNVKIDVVHGEGF